MKTLEMPTTAQTRIPGGLVAQLARDPQAVREAQRLRWQVFAAELGAKLHSPEAGIDEDLFDAHCEHLLVRASQTDEVVACTRLLFDYRAAGAGGFYSQSEFEMKSILRLPGRILEVGRTCVRGDRRAGSALSVLWSGLARIISSCGVDYLIGCASIPMSDGGAQAHAVMRRLRAENLTPESLRVKPRRALPPAVGTSVRPVPAEFPIPQADRRGEVPAEAALPHLLRTYLRLGASIGGEAFWDTDFHCADVFILLEPRRMDPRYARHFLAPAQAEVS
jgi:putative hemolysin